MEFKLKRFQKAIEITKIANIHYFEFTKEYHTFRDKHEFCELVYVDSGAILVDGEMYSGSLKNNQAIVHMANEVHSLSCKESEAPNVIIIGFECKSAELLRLSKGPVFLTGEQQSILTDVIKEGRNVFMPPYDVPNVRDMKKRKHYPFGADQMIKIGLEQFFISLIRSTEAGENEDKNTNTASAMLEVRSYIDENYREKISLDELCFIYGTNKTTLCSGFKSAYGETIVSYINHKRIKEAKRLLREGKLNLSQIAENLGFSSLHYFSRTFKQYEKKSPSEYINTIKAKLML